MKNARALLETGRQRAIRETVEELSELFHPWLAFPQDFGKGAYDRLFSPLAHLLAFPVSGAGR